MSERSLKATAEGIQTARKALINKKLTQENLANNLLVTRSTVSNFITGKAIDRKIFVSICETLDLDWQKISGDDNDEVRNVSNEMERIKELTKLMQQYTKQTLRASKISEKQQEDTLKKFNLIAMETGITHQQINDFKEKKDINTHVFIAICNVLHMDWRMIANITNDEAHSIENKIAIIKELVKLIKEHCAEDIRKRFGTMRVLDMEQPILLNEIYTDVNILEKLTRNQRREINELLDGCKIEDFYRWGLGSVQQKRVEGIKAVHRHSKMMLLGKPGAGKTTFLKFLVVACVDGDVFPDRVPIFVTLKDFADREKNCSLLQFLIDDFRRLDIEIAPILKSGKVLLLLDGLDEVRSEFDSRVLSEIKEFALNYSLCQIVITCRIAAKQYIFEQFTEVEVADFDELQITTFVGNWFRQKQVKAEDFMAELQNYRSVQELANSPLLLTLLCLAFEESGSFPANRAELYKEGLDALLRKWDAKRGIRRDNIYKDLSVQKKEDMLSQIALKTFEKGDYFVKQRTLEEYICDYIRNTVNAKNELEELYLDSEAVLKSIEAQHGLFVERARGIYSFSHLTFHEYFTARQIIVSTSPIKLESSLNKLVTNVTNKRWREVILLSVGMATEADDLLILMKQEIDNLFIGEVNLQRFLVWVDEKSKLVNSSFELAAIRAYYFATALNLFQDFVRASAFDSAFILTSKIDSAFDLELDLNLCLDLSLIQAYNQVRSRSVDRLINASIDCAKEIGDKELFKCLQALKKSVPDQTQDPEAYGKWLRTNVNRWSEYLLKVMIQHRNIGHDWQFTNKQKEKLQQYHDANLLLLECLKSDCYVSRETRQEIEESLLMPIRK